jgi:hypothetical protein
MALVLFQDCHRKPLSFARTQTKLGLMEWLGNVPFGKHDRALRRKNVRFLGLALILALFVCLLMGGLFYLLYRQGRI